ncbi:MAG: 50S ribosomal protein L9 [Thermoanaerobaculales bacterium]|nr:50S ribosomal protein L9 [Thermoanaerobaculales bacterium]
MKVILNDYIEHLGERGDSVVVKRGYANNYLLPKGLAYPDTPGNRRRFDQEQNNWEEMDLERRSAGEKLAASLEGTKLAFERRAGEKDVLFGSVSVSDIHRELQERGFDFDRKRILLEHPIKELGAVDVVVQIHRDISVTVPVRVVRPGEDPDAIAPEFVAEGRLEVSDEDLTTEAEPATEVAEETPAATEVPEVEDRPETGTVAE